MRTISLKFVWRNYIKLKADGNKLKAEGSKLLADGDKLWAEGDKLKAEGDKLWAEGSKLLADGDKLWAEGDKLWAEGVLEAYGNVTIQWDGSTRCIVDGTDTYDEHTYGAEFLEGSRGKGTGD